jgi:hypothetical protein
MKRLSLEELKANKNVVANLEVISGGLLNDCHDGQSTPPPSGGSTPVGGAPTRPIA